MSEHTTNSFWCTCPEPDCKVHQPPLYVRDLIAALKASEARVRELVTLLGDQHGTPCEQIRHQQDLEARDQTIQRLREEVAALREQFGHIALAWPSTDSRAITCRNLAAGMTIQEAKNAATIATLTDTTPTDKGASA